MKLLVSKLVIACLIALVGYSSANASPVYIESCFETEIEAKRRQNAFKFREIDNSEASQKDHRAMKFAWRDDVQLSELQAILGESQTKVDEQTNLMTHEWLLSLIGSPSAGEIRYDTFNGYCLSTRIGGMGLITYTCLLYTSPSPRDS